MVLASPGRAAAPSPGSLRRLLLVLLLGLAPAGSSTSGVVHLDVYWPAASPVTQWLNSVVVYDAPGLMKHLMVDVVDEAGQASDRQERAGGIDTIYRLRLKVKNPPAAIAAGSHFEFGPFTPFAMGVALENVERFADLGDHVGIRAFEPGTGAGDEGDEPRFAYGSTYYAFSMNGPCPNLPEHEKRSGSGFSEECLRYDGASSSEGNEGSSSGGGLAGLAGLGGLAGLVGGSDDGMVRGVYCSGLFRAPESETPDGTNGCVVSLEGLWQVSLDDVVGIKEQDCGGRFCENWYDFRLNCADLSLRFQDSDGRVRCREYASSAACASSCFSEGCEGSVHAGLPFWAAGGGRCSAARNEQRAAAVAARLEAQLERQQQPAQLLQSASKGTSASAARAAALLEAVQTAALLAPSLSWQDDAYYILSTPCDSFPLCDTPSPLAGTGYCSRDGSGICVPCYVPGTVEEPEVVPPGVPECRLNLFMAGWPTAPYAEQRPSCAGTCGGPCEEASLCCIYRGECTQDWKVSDWSDCSSSCGPGVRKREVWSPYAMQAIACDEETRPAEQEFCRGNQCPWQDDPLQDSPWSLCSNGCGAGLQQRRLVCACPAPCAANNADCAASPVEGPVERLCYGAGREAAAAEGAPELEYCGECAIVPMGAAACSRCIDGFSLLDLGGGVRCSNDWRFVRLVYEIGAGKALHTDTCMAAALPPAFAEALAQVLQVVGATVVSQTGVERSSIKTRAVVVVRCQQEESDADLAAVAERLASAPAAAYQSIAEQLRFGLLSRGCETQLAFLWVRPVLEVQRFCSGLVPADGGCP